MMGRANRCLFVRRNQYESGQTLELAELLHSACLVDSGAAGSSRAAGCRHALSRHFYSPQLAKMARTQLDADHCIDLAPLDGIGPLTMNHDH